MKVQLYETQNTSRRGSERGQGGRPPSGYATTPGRVFSVAAADTVVWTSELIGAAL